MESKSCEEREEESSGAAELKSCGEGRRSKSSVQTEMTSVESQKCLSWKVPLKAIWSHFSAMNRDTHSISVQN